VVYRLRSVPEILLQPKQRWTDVEWFREAELVDIDDLKVRYPDKAAAIADAKDQAARRGSEESQSGNEVFVYTYWHKSIPAIEKGRKIVMLEECVLESVEHPFSGAPLNIVRLTDIDLEGNLHGYSFLNNLAVPQIALNKLYTLQYTNIALGSHIYWLIHSSARVGKDRVRNSASILQWSGVHKPEIATFRTVGVEIPSMIEKLEQRILTISRIQQTSRGELPANVEAGIAIRILEEQEQQSALPDIKKVNAAIEKLFSLSLGIVGDKYDPKDGRTLRVLGKDGEYLVETLDTAKLSGPYDIKTRKATALSKSKALMTQEITQLEAMRPGTFSSEQIYDLLELGDKNKFYDVATAAKRTADWENQMMREEKEILEPQAGEYHLVHWRSHMLEIQTPTFRARASEEVREAFENHIGITEMLLTEQAKQSIKLASELATEDYFPAFYTPDFTIPEIIMALQNGDRVPLLGEEPMAEPMQPEAPMMAGSPNMEAEPLPEEMPPMEQMTEELPMGEPLPESDPVYTV
jgi:hypothetical protein